MSISDGDVSPVQVLRTLKARAVSVQIQTIRELAVRYVRIHRAFKTLIAIEFKNSMFRISISNDRERVVAGLLLAIVAADIETVPDRPERNRVRRDFEHVCAEFNVTLADISRLLRYSESVERLMVDK